LGKLPTTFNVLSGNLAPLALQGIRSRVDEAGPSKPSTLDEDRLYVISRSWRGALSEGTINLCSACHDHHFLDGNHNAVVFIKKINTEDINIAGRKRIHYDLQENKFSA
jgi:hypothetical protein